MAGEPYCATSGACVACLTDSMCSGNTPICDGSANACRGCEADTECTSGVCLASNGTCADPASIVYVRDDGNDVGDCTATSPCLTLSYAFSKFSPKNVVKILSGSYSVAGTVPVEISGFIEGSMTTLSGGGSGGVFEIDGLNVTISNMTIVATGSLPMAANVKAGLLTLYGVTLESNIEVDGGQLEVDRSTLQNVNCGQNGSASEGGIVDLSRSGMIAVAATGCTVTLEQNTIDQTSQPNNAPMITLSGGKYTVENNVVVSNNSFTDPVSLFSAPDGSVFRFNTLVNLSGENQTATSLACDGTATAVTDNIVAWNSSAQPQCATTYTLYDQFESLPPGIGNQVGSASTFFANMANKDFHLATGSPAIGAAQPGTCIPNDHDGNPRGSACDVGAFEAP
ncbi:MAG TPA: choice-of-anchor Q domain-containing protein [Kofleriaceae bacterium]